MNNGWIEKFDANRARLEANGDISELQQIRDEMEQGGFDANDEQWEALNSAVKDLPEEDREQAEAEEREKSREGEVPAGSSERPRPQASNDVEETGVAVNQRLVSSDEPGTGSNPIGYPGTDQDQDGPGARKNVPGMKTTEKKGR